MINPAPTPDQFSASVIAVPPLSRRANYSLNSEGNRRILAHLAGGGVTIALYGGNANFYNLSVSEFGPMLDMLAEMAPPEMWIIPSVGADYGKSQDQIRVLRDRPFSTAMVLPLGFPATSAGVATGLRKLADLYRRPLIAYVKSASYIDVTDLARVIDDGAVCAVKYAIVRDDPRQDRYLSKLVETIDRSRIVSGIGERPAAVHLTDFGLNGFTSGSVCVAPALSTELLRALKVRDGDKASRIRELFLPLEDLRDGHSPLRVLHAAVGLTGIADPGPLLPFLDTIEDPAILDAIRKAATALLAHNADFAPPPRAFSTSSGS